MKTTFEIAKSGLFSAERSLSTTANNIINANTPGYSRQRVDKAPMGQNIGHLNMGLGVNVLAVNRARNEMIDLQLHQRRSHMGMMQEQKAVFEQLEASLITDSGADLDYRIGRFFDLFSELSNDPQDMSVRNNLVSEAVQLTSHMRDISDSMEQISENSSYSGEKTIQRINELLNDLSKLNETIRSAEAMNRPDNAGLDMRVKLLEELSGLVDFETTNLPSGSLGIHIGGVEVLSETVVRPLQADINNTDKTFVLRLDNGTVVRPTGGKLAAAMSLYTDDIPALKERLDLLAETIVTEVNALHQQGFGLLDDQPRDFFDPAGTDASSIRVLDEIVADHRHVAASSVAGEAGNSEIAASMANLRNERLIDGSRVVDYAVRLMSEPGSRLSHLRNEMQTRESEIQMLEEQQQRESGVNLDEELTLMIQYQNAYQGAARVLAAAQNMYDTLLSVLR